MEWLVAAGSIFLLLLFCILYTYKEKKKLQKRFYDYQEKVMERQLTEVREIYSQMRGWRHDYHNHLQLMKAYLEKKQWNEMHNYLNLLEGDLDQIKTAYDTGNVNLDAILNSKLSLAEKEEIEINCKTEISGIISIEDTDLCALIGNLIDNGVEACQKIPSCERRFLRIYLCTRKSQLYISVTNATKEVIRKLDADYITQKRGNHGHGLKRINLVVEKYQGYIKRANEPGVFTTEIMLPLMEKSR